MGTFRTSNNTKSFDIKNKIGDFSHKRVHFPEFIPYLGTLRPIFGYITSQKCLEIKNLLQVNVLNVVL